MSRRPASQEVAWGLTRNIIVNRLYTGDMVWNRRAEGRFHRISAGRAVTRDSMSAGQARDNPETDQVQTGGGAALDLEPYEGKGKELPASETVLRRVFARHGPALADIILVDAPYLTVGMLRLSRQELRTHLLVKTKELDTPNILQDAEAIFQSPEFARDVEPVCETDADRGMAYEVWAAAGFHPAGYEPLKVARVEVTMLQDPRQGQTQRFWIVTTDETLMGEPMREPAHLRWRIENHTLRALNAAVNCKHVWRRGKQADETWATLMLLMFPAFTPVSAYHGSLDPETLSQALGIRYVTLGYLTEC